MKAFLNPRQVKQVWNYACVGSKAYSIAKDFLGARIEYSKYDQDDLQGWCAEYVIPPKILNQECGKPVNPVTEANIRVINIKNYYANNGHRNGEYCTFYKYSGDKNIKMTAYQVSKISDEGIKALKLEYGLSDEFLESYFK